MVIVRLDFHQPVFTPPHPLPPFVLISVSIRGGNSESSLDYVTISQTRLDSHETSKKQNDEYPTSHGRWTKFFGLAWLTSCIWIRSSIEPLSWSNQMYVRSIFHAISPCGEKWGKSINKNRNGLHQKTEQIN